MRKNRDIAEKKRDYTCRPGTGFGSPDRDPGVLVQNKETGNLTINRSKRTALFLEMMLFIFALTLAFLSFASAAKSAAGFKPFTVGKSLIKDNKIEKILGIRGGATLGPINEGNFVKGVGVVYIVYIAQLALAPEYTAKRIFGTTTIQVSYLQYVAIWLSALTAFFFRADVLSVITYSAFALAAAFFFHPNSCFLPSAKQEVGILNLVIALLGAYLKFA